MADLMAQYRVSAKAIIRDDEQRVLLCKEKNGFWDFPGGGVDWGETAEEAVRREVKEEMGVEVLSVSSQPIAVVFDQFRDSKSWFVNIFFETAVASYEITPSDECQEIGFFSKEMLQNITSYSSVPKFFDLQ